MSKRARYAVGFFLVLGLFLAEVIYAQEFSAVFEAPEDVILIWAKRVGLIMTVAAAMLILFTVLFRSRRLGEYQSKWLLFFGLGVLPLPVMLLSNGVGLEQSKEISFCESCHVMDAFLDNMKDPESDTLASLHYNNRYIQHGQCWTCHSDYGIFGTAEAKLGGLIDVYVYLTRSYELPIVMRHDYSFTICLNCHAESALFRNEESHEGVVEEVLSGGMGCTDCHQMAHPEREERSTE
jgi:cytochrome c nitrite reductase small subunit